MYTFPELLKMSNQDLSTELQRARFDLMKISIALKTGQSKASHERGQRKKYVARIQTAMQ